MLDQFRAQKLEWNRANNQIYDRVETSSGDSNGRTLFVQISNGGTVEDLTGATLSLAWSKRTEQGLETFEEVDAKKGQYRLFYPTGMLVNHGVLQASLVLVDVTGRIESKPFDIIVHKGTVDDEAVESDNKFTALTTALVKVSQVQAEFDSLYAEKSQMMDTLHDDKKADMEVLEADYSNRANTLESTYAPRLTEAESEIDMARGGATTLSERLNETATKMDVAKISSGTPLFVKNTSEMIDTNRNYVNTSDGYVYIYINSNWIKTTILYQSKGIDDNSVGFEKIDDVIQRKILKDNETSDLSGSVLKLDNMIKGVVIDYSASADATKITTYGKNLLNPFLFTSAYTTLAVNSNIITFKNNYGYGVAESITMFLAKGTYTLSASDSLGMSVRSKENTYLFGLNAGLNQKISFTIDTSDIYIFAVSIPANASTSFVDLMLEVGAAKTNFVLFDNKKEYLVGSKVFADEVIMSDGDNINVTYKTNKVKDDVVPLPYTNPLFEKKLAIAGDSIAFGAGATGGFGRYIAENNRMSMENVAKSGATITANVVDGSGNTKPCIATSVNTMTTNADYYILEGSVNDYALLGENRHGTYNPNGYTTTLDIETFLGAFEYMLRTSVTRFEGKKILYVFVHGIFQMSTTYYTVWRLEMIALLNKYGVPYLELDKTIPPLCNIESLKTKYTSNADGWHPNELGYKTFYVDQITQKLKTI